MTANSVVAPSIILSAPQLAENIGAAARVMANFGLSGALAKDSQHGNTYRGVTLKWSEPADARVPSFRWRFYVFKKSENIGTLHLHRQSAFLVGREKKICDLLVEHPSCSKQHAVVQLLLAFPGRARLRNGQI